MSEILEGRTTRDRFHLICKVEKKNLSHLQKQSGGKSSIETHEVILLIPEQTSEADCFYSAWLPTKMTADEIAQIKDYKPYSEVVMESGYPVGGYFRGAVEWGNNLIPQPHIFVMTKAAEEKLKHFVGQKIRVDTLGDGEEEFRYELKAETESFNRLLE